MPRNAALSMNSQSPVNLLEFNRILRTTLLLPVVLLALLAGLLVWQIQETLVVQSQVDHSDQILRTLHRLGSLALDQETGMRGYQLTGLPATLDPYHTAATRIDKTLTSLRSLYAESSKTASPDQFPAFTAMAADLHRWQEFAAATVQGRAKSLPQGEELTIQGKRLMDTFRSDIDSLVRSESVERDALSTQVRHRVDNFLLVVLGLALAAGILIGTVTSSRLKRVSNAYNSALQQLQRRNAELSASQHLLLTTLESIGDAVISCDAAGTVLFMNAVAQKLTQWPLAEAANRPLGAILKLVNEHTHQPIANILEEVRRSQTRQLASQSLLVARDGTEYSVDHTTCPVQNDGDTPQGMVVVFRDVTELRHAEANLIANEKLAVTGRLAASIAHEIHNPLDSVANLHFLLASEHDSGKRSEYLTLAQQELGRTLQISRAMLSLYRESQVPVQVNLEELISSVLLLLDRKMKDQGIVVEQSYTHPTEVQGFPGELRQVFTNLIANAAEAAGSRGRVRIQIHPATPQDGRAGSLVEISDSGPGIAPHVEKKLFQPFITTKGERGTGLGLWVSLGIIQKHGGTVRITNNVHGELHGAIVRVYLPEKTAMGFVSAQLPA